jgi:hypothetical protein
VDPLTSASACPPPTWLWHSRWTPFFSSLLSPPRDISQALQSASSTCPRHIRPRAPCVLHRRPCLPGFVALHLITIAPSCHTLRLPPCTACPTMPYLLLLYTPLLQARASWSMCEGVYILPSHQEHAAMHPLHASAFPRPGMALSKPRFNTVYIVHAHMQVLCRAVLEHAYAVHLLFRLGS